MAVRATKADVRLGKLGSWAERDTVVVSPNRRRYGHRSLLQGSASSALWTEWVYVDGVRSEDCFFRKVTCPILFSPDSSRVAYAIRPRRRSGFTMVVDGVAHDHDGLVTDYAFGKDGRRLAYGVGLREPAIVVDDTRIPVDGDPFGLLLSPDDSSLAYHLRRRRHFVVVKDGAEWGPYDGVWHMLYSPVGNRLAALVVPKGKLGWCVVVDGELLPGGRDVKDIQYSASGASLAYAARRGGKWSVVVNGTPGPQYADVNWLQFVPDTETVAYAATERKGLFHRSTALVVDDGIVSQHKDVSSFHFFPDGRRYCLSCDTGCFIGAPGEPLARLPVSVTGRPVFAPDGGHFAHTRHTCPGHALVVDGETVVSLDYEPVPSGSHLAFVGSDTLELCTMHFNSDAVFRTTIVLEEGN